MLPSGCRSVVVLLALALLPRGIAASDGDVAQARFARLTRGINVGWLNNSKCRLNRELAEKEARLIEAAGCRHVRLYLNVDGLRDAAARDKPDVQKLPELDAAIDLALSHDLAVIVDAFHYGVGGLLKFPGPADPEAEVMLRFWATLAGHLAKYDPQRVFLEVANEPGLENPLDWYAVEIRILQAMRASAPRHTLIAGYNLRSGPKEWDGVKALTMFPVVADRNVIYNFHYYHPMTLTHQGASWVKSVTSRLRDVPYPVDPQIIQPLLQKTDDPQARAALERYAEDRWNRQKIRGELAVVADWARQHGVLATCNEFGVHRPNAPLAARAAWTRDVRQSLEELGIGWTIWDGSFGFLVRSKDGQVSADRDILEALGLKMLP